MLHQDKSIVFRYIRKDRRCDEVKTKYKKQFIGLVAIVAIILCAGYICFYHQTTNQMEKEDPIIIPTIFLCDEMTQNKSNADLIEEFNELYKGKYYLDVEWFTGNAADYRARIKMLNSVNELPAIITDVGFDPAFYKLLIENKQIINLAPYWTEDEEWKKCFSEEVIKSVIEENGEIYMMPLNTTYYSGIFWNKELFAKAGIKTFPTTWEEFWRVCDELKSAGITPISLHTAGTSWASMILATSYMGQSEEGSEFMKQVFPNTYNVEAFYEMLEVYKKAFQYTTDDAIGNNFDVAEKHFYMEETAMIPNGRWMIERLENNEYATKGFEDKVSFSAFPENVLIGAPAMSGWAICANYDEQVREGAIAFLKFRNQKDYTDTKALLESSVYEAYDQVLKEYFGVVSQPFHLVPNYQLKWNSLIQNQVFNKDLPELLSNHIDSAEFVRRLDEAVEVYNRESKLEDYTK